MYCCNTSAWRIYWYIQRRNIAIAFAFRTVFWQSTKSQNMKSTRCSFCKWLSLALCMTSIDGSERGKIDRIKKEKGRKKDARKQLLPLSVVPVRSYSKKRAWQRSCARRPENCLEDHFTIERVIERVSFGNGSAVFFSEHLIDLHSLLNVVLVYFQCFMMFKSVSECTMEPFDWKKLGTQIWLWIWVIGNRFDNYEKTFGWILFDYYHNWRNLLSPRIGRGTFKKSLLQQFEWFKYCKQDMRKVRSKEYCRAI